VFLQKSFVILLTIFKKGVFRGFITTNDELEADFRGIKRSSLQHNLHYVAEKSFLFLKND